MTKIYGTSDLDYNRLHRTILEDLLSRKIQAQNYEKYFKFPESGDMRREVLTILCLGKSEGHDEYRFPNGRRLYHFTEDNFPLARIDVWGISVGKSNIEVSFSDLDSETSKIINAIKTLNYIEFDGEVKSIKPINKNKQYRESNQAKEYFFDAMKYRGDPISSATIREFLYNTKPKDVDEWSCKNKFFIKYCTKKWDVENELVAIGDREKTIMRENVKGFTVKTLWRWYQDNLLSK